MALVSTPSFAGGGFGRLDRDAGARPGGHPLAMARAELNAAQARLNLYASDVALAARAIQRDDFGLARRTLEALRPHPGQTDLRGFAWRYLWNLCRGDQLATLSGHEWIVTCVAFSPDGRRLVTGSMDGTARIWDLAGRTNLTVLGPMTGAVWSVAFTRDGAPS